MKIPNEISQLGLNFAQLVKKNGCFQFFSLGLQDERGNVIPTGLPLIARLDTQTRAIYKLSVAEAMSLTATL